LCWNDCQGIKIIVVVNLHCIVRWVGENMDIEIRILNWTHIGSKALLAGPPAIHTCIVRWIGVNMDNVTLFAGRIKSCG